MLSQSVLVRSLLFMHEVFVSRDNFDDELLLLDFDGSQLVLLPEFKLDEEFLPSCPPPLFEETLSLIFNFEPFN